ncbi:hypothetical protein HYV87_00605 [Candidatus Woesearchaeota archaeon]|nr:hypothetical protein [Candidatus Woesearchaeota archaeon]
MVLDRQVILPGQAVVSVTTNLDGRIGPYGNELYRAVFLSGSRGSGVGFTHDDYSLSDFSYYLAREESIKELVNYETITRKRNSVTTGFTPDDFAVLERQFKAHRKAMKGIYMVSLRGGRVNYI